MRASPFIGPLEKEALEWDETLNRLQEVVDNWLACQATWQYLEPIFTSPDIMKQMPEEGDKFLQACAKPSCCLSTPIALNHSCTTCAVKQLGVTWYCCFPYERALAYLLYCLSLASKKVQYSTVQYSTVQYSTVQYSTVQYSTVQKRQVGKHQAWV